MLPKVLMTLNNMNEKYLDCHWELLCLLLNTIISDLQNNTMILKKKKISTDLDKT